MRGIQLLTLNMITYTPYINCAHYKTKGYDSLKEN